jgi:hypothetical protein
MGERAANKHLPISVTTEIAQISVVVQREVSNGFWNSAIESTKQKGITQIRHHERESRESRERVERERERVESRE